MGVAVITCHQFQMNTKCPINGTVDTYEIEISVDTFITVEDIKEALEKFYETTLFQEELTTQIADVMDTISGLVSVVTNGSHGTFKTTCTWTADEDRQYLPSKQKKLMDKLRAD